MKKIKLLLAILLFNFVMIGQIRIGKLVPSSESVLLEFEDDSDKTLILPIVSNPPANATKGTVLLDRASKIVMFYNGSWISLTDSQTRNTLPTEYTNSDFAEAGLVLGAETTTAQGILVLESTTQAMVLPRVHSPEENIPIPYPGTVCYDLDSKTVAVFSGNKWFYFK